MDAEHLRALWKNANELARAAEEAAAEFNLELLRALRKRNAPPGYTIDVHGDGKLKPSKDCKTVTPTE